jgi:predicted PurR-regulated permease PerM
MSGLDNAAKIAIVVIGVVVFFIALDATQTFSAPVVLAIVTGIIISPISDRMSSLGLSRNASASLSFLFGIVAIVLLLSLLQPAVTRAIDAFPTVYSELNAKVFQLQAELRGLKEVEENVREIVDPEAARKGSDTSSDNSPSDAIPSVEDVVLLAPSVFGQALVYLGTFFFFVLTRTEIYQWVARRVVSPEERSQFAQRLSAAERQVSRYFLTISAINAGLGSAVALAMMVVGLPSPILWGIAAFLLNYLIYLGPAALAAAFLVAGLTVFDNLYSVTPAAVYLTLNAVESQFVTPTLLGKSLLVNPLLIFLTVTFFLWLWGPLGAIVAIPLLLWGIALSGIAPRKEQSAVKAS